MKNISTLFESCPVPHRDSFIALPWRFLPEKKSRENLFPAERHESGYYCQKRPKIQNKLVFSGYLFPQTKTNKLKLGLYKSIYHACFRLKNKKINKSSNPVIFESFECHRISQKLTDPNRWVNYIFGIISIDANTILTCLTLHVIYFECVVART